MLACFFFAKLLANLDVFPKSEASFIKVIHFLRNFVFVYILFYFSVIKCLSLTKKKFKFFFQTTFLYEF